MHTAVILRATSCAALSLCLTLAACDDGAPDTSADAAPVEMSDGSAGESEPNADEPAGGDAAGGDEDGGPLAGDASTGGTDGAVAGLDAQSSPPDANTGDAGTAVDAPAAGSDAGNADTGAPQCTPNCAARSCGDDGCGGACGQCQPGRTCSAGSCVCTPSCGGRMCGSNGCGGSCGDCTAGTCNASGQCVVPARSFASDVYPIFTAAGCPGCHRASASSPAAGLALTPLEAAYATLVATASTRCAPARAFVAAGNPDGSYLINKLSGVGLCAGGRMPLNRTPLNSAQMDVIRAWISGGAGP